MNRLTAAFILFLLALSSHAQQNVTDTLLAKFSRHGEHSLQEKVYAHVDRNFYLTGETLWFKIYLVDGYHHKPLALSKVAYAEILDRQNFPVLQAKIEVTDGKGNGSFFLPASLSSGNYKLRIYTNWMKNFSPEFFFHTPISIVNPFTTLPAAERKGSRRYAVDFFPEGGNLVAGVQSRIAFRISDPEGRGTWARGFILNGSDTLASFVPARSGIGSFLFTPRAGERYKVVLSGQGYGPIDQTFPEIQPTGYAMHVRDSGKTVIVDVRARNVQGTVNLFVHSRHLVVHAASQTLTDNAARFIIRKSDLPAGISHLTLFNSELKPVAERLYFTFPESRLDIDASLSAATFTPRKKVAVTLQTKTQEGQPVAASLSLAAFRIDSLSQYSPTGIFPYLWLSSDLAGEVESAGSYFTGDNSDIAAMDHLMLTQGWRRFNWKDVLADEREYVHLPEVNGHIINAVVTRNGAKEPGIFTYLGSPGKIIRAYGSWSDAAGEVRFEIRDFYGPRKIIIQTKADTTKTYKISVADPYSKEMSAVRAEDLKIDERMAKELLRRSVAMQVQDIFYYEEYGNRFVTPQVDSSAFYGSADETYYLDDYTRFPVMEEVMREYVPSVFVRKRKDGFHFLVIDQANGGTLPGDPMVLVDGIPVFDVDEVMKLDPLLVRKLEVVKQEYYLGLSAFSGIVSYATYNGDLGNLELPAGSITLDYEGLQIKRIFHSPRYRVNDRDRMPDQRHLLHWEPDIRTDGNGNQRIEFFTSDVPGRYAVMIEGLSADGLCGSKLLTFEVKPGNQ